jgi:hypothetical protein
MIATHKLEISTKGQGDARDITEKVAAAVAASDARLGLVTVFVVGSTAGITTIRSSGSDVGPAEAGPYVRGATYGQRRTNERRVPRNRTRPTYVQLRA